jgi:hypothetical protein
MNHRSRKGLTFIIIQFVFLIQLNGQQEGLFKLQNPDSWTMVLIPDPQSYVKFDHNQPILDIVTTWIKANLDELNIKLVLCTGDIVDSNNELIPDPAYGGNQSAWQQWDAVSRSFGKLDNVVPYILCVGNHDIEISDDWYNDSRYSQFNSWFAPNKNPLTENLLVEMFTNASGVKTMENALYQFTSPHGVQFLICSLEFNPRNVVVQQTSRILQQEKYQDHKCIILTHSYLQSDNQRVKKESYLLKDVTYGEELWKELIAPSTNIEMVICGHIAGKSHREHVGYRIDENAVNKSVHQILFNAQWEGGGPNGNGGDGWIRILEFLPDKRTVKIKTFSPLFAISPETRERSFRTENYDQFVIKLF